MSCFRNASFEYRFAARHSALAVLVVYFLCCFAKKGKIGIVYVYFQAALNAGTYDPPFVAGFLQMLSEPPENRIDGWLGYYSQQQKHTPRGARINIIDLVDHLYKAAKLFPNTL